MDHIFKHIKFYCYLGSVLLACMLSHIIDSDILSSDYLMSFVAPDADFEMCDFYTRVANRNPVEVLDSNVVIVDIADGDRLVVAQALERINEASPCAIALDVFFANPQDADVDEYLIETIKSCNNLFLPVIVDKNEYNSLIALKPFVTDHLSSPGLQVCNLNATDRHAVVRRFKRDYIVENDTLNGMATTLAKEWSKAHNKALPTSLDEENLINYSGLNFNIVSMAELDTMNLSTLTNKVLIIGSMNDDTDIHNTPIGDMQGVMIQAISTASIIRSSVTLPLSSTMTWAIAIICCLVIVAIKIHADNSDVGPLWERFSQAILLVLIVITGCWLFENHHIFFDPSVPLIMVALSLMCYDIVSCIINIIQRRSEKKKN